MNQILYLILVVSVGVYACLKTQSPWPAVLFVMGLTLGALFTFNFAMRSAQEAIRETAAKLGTRPPRPPPARDDESQ